MLLVGAGGLGSSAALYLAAAGVGTLSIADSDTIEESNLQRQVIHSEAGVGQSKALSAASACLRLNSRVRAVPLPAMTPANVADVVSMHSIVVRSQVSVSTTQMHAATDAVEPLRFEPSLSGRTAPSVVGESILLRFAARLQRQRRDALHALGRRRRVRHPARLRCLRRLRRPGEPPLFTPRAKHPLQPSSFGGHATIVTLPGSYFRTGDGPVRVWRSQGPLLPLPLPQGPLCWRLRSLRARPDDTPHALAQPRTVRVMCGPAALRLLL